MGKRDRRVVVELNFSRIQFGGLGVSREAFVPRFDERWDDLGPVCSSLTRASRK